MNLFRPLWFTWKGKDGYGGGGGAIYKLKYFIFCQQKKHRENGKSTGKT